MVPRPAHSYVNDIFCIYVLLLIHPVERGAPCKLLFSEAWTVVHVGVEMYDSNLSVVFLGKHLYKGIRYGVVAPEYNRELACLDNLGVFFLEGRESEIVVSVLYRAVAVVSRCEIVEYIYVVVQHISAVSGRSRSYGFCRQFAVRI